MQKSCFLIAILFSVLFFSCADNRNAASDLALAETRGKEEETAKEKAEALNTKLRDSLRVLKEKDSSATQLVTVRAVQILEDGTLKKGEHGEGKNWPCMYSSLKIVFFGGNKKEYVYELPWNTVYSEDSLGHYVPVQLSEFHKKQKKMEKIAKTILYNHKNIQLGVRGERILKVIYGKDIIENF